MPNVGVVPKDWENVLGLIAEVGYLNMRNCIALQEDGVETSSFGTIAIGPIRLGQLLGA